MLNPSRHFFLFSAFFFLHCISTLIQWKNQCLNNQADAYYCYSLIMK